MCCALQMSAQRTVYVNTMQGNDLSKYDQQTVNVTSFRVVFQGWNTICLPFGMTEAELNATFGNDCRLETLTDVRVNGTEQTLVFGDVKAQGLEAGKPYILWYGGESNYVTIRLQGKQLTTEQHPIHIGAITFSGIAEQTEGTGRYGILARDNATAQFVSVGGTVNGFFATRCAIDNDLQGNLLTVHGDATGVASLSTVNGGQQTAAFNLAGQRVGADHRGITVQDGHKVLR